MSKLGRRPNRSMVMASIPSESNFYLLSLCMVFLFYCITSSVDSAPAGDIIWHNKGFIFFFWEICDSLIVFLAMHGITASGSRQTWTRTRTICKLWGLIHAHFVALFYITSSLQGSESLSCNYLTDQVEDKVTSEKWTETLSRRLQPWAETGFRGGTMCCQGLVYLPCTVIVSCVISRRWRISFNAVEDIKKRRSILCCWGDHGTKCATCVNYHVMI